MKIAEEVILSRQNPTVKYAASLLEKKGRDAAGSFLTQGVKLAREAAMAGLSVQKVLVLASERERILPILTEAFSSELYRETPCVLLGEDAFMKISTEKAPQGVICIIKNLDFYKNNDIIMKRDFPLGEKEHAMALCSVRDPGNLGSVIRSAVAFGVTHLVLSDDCADVYNPKVVRSAMGCMFRVKITRTSDLAGFLTLCREMGRTVYSAELSDSALSLSDVRLSPTDIIVIGNEGHGVSPEVSAAADHALYIPISENAESLNASVAAALLMWEQSK